MRKNNMTVYFTALLLISLGCSESNTLKGPEGTLQSGNGPAIFGLAAEDNPNNVLSCYVRWTTDVPSSAAVEFGTDGFRFRIRGEGESTEHRVFVIGMHAEAKYRIKAISTTPDGTSISETAYRTAPLPEIVRAPVPGAHNKDRAQDGWTLMNLSNMAAMPPSPAVALMVDFEGIPVWYSIVGTESDAHGDTPMSLEGDNTLTIGGVAYALPPRQVNLEGNLLWEGDASRQQQRQAITHEFRKLDDDRFVALREKYDDAGMNRGDMVEVFKKDLSVVWQWSVFDHITWEPVGGGDWSHCNSVTVDPAANVFYLSCRNFDNIYKVSMSGNMDVLAIYGEGGDYAADRSSLEPWFAEQHDPEIQPNGNILIYDNGTSERGHSRVVEYAFNDATKQATIVWEFPGNFTVDDWYRNRWFSNYWGDADKQPNGNVRVLSASLHEKIKKSV